MNSKVYANNRLLRGMNVVFTILFGLVGLIFVSLLMLLR